MCLEITPEQQEKVVCDCIHDIGLVIHVVMSTWWVVHPLQPLRSLPLQVHAVLGPGPGHQVFSERYNIRITRADLSTLNQLNWLNDEVLKNLSKFTVVITCSFP